MKMEGTIGSIIRNIREEQGIVLTKLCCGLCSPATLSRVEKDERDMTMIFFECILGRLGYYPDGFEFYMSESEYQQYEQRKKIYRLQKREEILQVEKELEAYQKRWKKEICTDVLQQQFVNSVEGFLLYKGNKNLQGIARLEKALQITVPDWKGQWIRNSIASEMELRIMELLAELYALEGNVELANEIRKNILRYLQRQELKSGEILELYTKVICIQISYELEQMNLQYALQLCEEGLSALSKRMRLFHWPELLLWKARCLEMLWKAGKEVRQKMLNTYIRAYYIHRLFEKYDTAEQIREYLDEEEPGWEHIRLEML